MLTLKRCQTFYLIKKKSKKGGRSFSGFGFPNANALYLTTGMLGYVSRITREESLYVDCA